MIVNGIDLVYHSADYIFIFFGITEPILVSLKFEFCSTLKGVNSVANFITAYEEYPIFYLQCEAIFFFFYLSDY